MGQVFTWDAIDNGRIPKTENFHQVAAILRERLLYGRSVASALLFGSVVRGDFNIRSDVDCVVLYRTEQQESAMHTMQELDQIARASHVPINFTPCDTVLAKTRLHHLSTTFVEHLQASVAAGGLIKGDLFGTLAQTIPAAEEIESYIKMRMYSLQESFAQMSTLSEERLVVLLKKALEAPTHVARKMLIYKNVLRGDSKRAVQERYRETMPQGLVLQLDRLLIVDQGYSKDLEEQILRPGQAEYLATIGNLAKQLPHVLEFIRTNILYLN